MVSMRSRRPSVDDSIQPTQAAAAIGGAKTIGLIGGVALLINNITGSAMVLFPSLYQAAGWFVVSLALGGVAFLSYLCSIMIIEAMAAMPGNHTFNKRVEYTTLSYYYLGKRGYYLTQFFFQFSLAFNNMSSIIRQKHAHTFPHMRIALLSRT
jgi:amino acid permease